MSDGIDFLDFTEGTKVQSILVVDDDPADQLLAREQLKALWPDCKIVEAASLHESYEICRKETFDLVLLDLNLPDGFGPNTVQEMRKFNPRVPIIVMTGMLSQITASVAMKLGANSITQKSNMMNEAFSIMLKGSLDADAQ